MKNRKKSGICSFCQKEFGKRAMKTHLNKCSEKLSYEESKRKSRGESYLFLIEDKYVPEFWLYVEIPGKLYFRDIDLFLREIWLECCGHLSGFYDIEVREKMFKEMRQGKLFLDNDFDETDPWEIEEDTSLSEVIREGLLIEYNYDFGSTTELVMKFLEEKNSYYGKHIRLLAQNSEVIPDCYFCKNKAEYLCSFCFEDPFCENCVDKHPCVQEEGETYMVSPIVNSPRAGVCGYVGTDPKRIKKYFPNLKK